MYVTTKLIGIAGKAIAVLAKLRPASAGLQRAALKYLLRHVAESLMVFMVVGLMSGSSEGPSRPCFPAPADPSDQPK